MSMPQKHTQTQRQNKTEIFVVLHLSSSKNRDSNTGRIYLPGRSFCFFPGFLVTHFGIKPETALYCPVALLVWAFSSFKINIACTSSNRDLPCLNTTAWLALGYQPGLCLLTRVKALTESRICCNGLSFPKTRPAPANNPSWCWAVIQRIVGNRKPEKFLEFGAKKESIVVVPWPNLPLVLSQKSHWC